MDTACIPCEPSRKRARVVTSTLTCGPFCVCALNPDGTHPRLGKVLKSFWPKPHVRVNPFVDKKRLIERRRWFHQYPELSYKEKETAKKIETELKSYAVDLGDKVKIVTGVDGTYGLWCDVSFGRDPREEDPFIMCRADMDALPIVETTNASYASTRDGVMHACGHDGHMAILLTVGSILMSSRYRDVGPGSRLKGRVRLVFQPAEEGGAGAKRMIAGGCLDGIQRVYGLHLWNHQPVGTVGVAKGAITANSDRFSIRVEGKGGHGSGPHHTIDAIVVGAQIVTALQTVVSRSVNPSKAAVVSVGTFQAGYAANVIADVATMNGTVRTRDRETKSIVMKRMKDICDGIETATGARVVFQYKHGYPATISTEDDAEIVRDAARTVLKDEDITTPHSTLAGEDMSFYLLERPGAFFFVGSSDPNVSSGDAIPHHRPDFDIDERSLEVGVSVFLRVIEKQLSTTTKEN